MNGDDQRQPSALERLDVLEAKVHALEVERDDAHCRLRHLEQALGTAFVPPPQTTIGPAG